MVINFHHKFLVDLNRYYKINLIITNFYKTGSNHFLFSFNQQRTAYNFYV